MEVYLSNAAKIKRNHLEMLPCLGCFWGGSPGVFISIWDLAGWGGVRGGSKKRYFVFGFVHSRSISLVVFVPFLLFIADHGFCSVVSSFGVQSVLCCCSKKELDKKKMVSFCLANLSVPVPGIYLTCRPRTGFLIFECSTTERSMSVQPSTWFLLFG